MTSCCDFVADPVCAGGDWECPAGSRLVDRCAPAPECDDCPPRVSDTCTDECCFELGPPRCEDGSWVCPSGSLRGTCLPRPDCGSPDAGMPPTPDFRSCSGDDVCVVASESCCGCLESLEGALGLREDAVSAYYADRCGDVLCAPCPEPPNPELVATCAAGVCEARDVGALEVTACESDAECVLRSRDCCECGGDITESGLIAIRRDAGAAYMDLVCGGVDGCAGCAPIYPEEFLAVCGDDGHCEVHPAG